MSSARRTAALGAAIAALVLAAAAGSASAQAADCPGADAQPTAATSGAIGQTTLCLLNAERTSRGLPALRENAVLSGTSLAYSKEMVARSFFAHVAPDGTDLVKRLTVAGYLGKGIDDWAVGENLAWAQGYLSTPRGVVAAWMASPGHRENILSGDYTEIGIGVADGIPQAGQPGTTFTTDFGSRDFAAPAAAGTGAPRRAVTRRPKPKPKASRRKSSRLRAHSASTRRGRRTVWMARIING